MIVIQDIQNGEEYKYQAPASWNQLTEKQLLIWAGICVQKIPLDHAIRAALMLLCGIPERLFFKLSDDQLMQIQPRIRFLFGRNELTRWVIHSFKHRGVMYHGPADFLGNLTIKEFRRTEIYYQKYQATGEPKFLRLLAATLYRPKRTGVIDDDIREPLREHEVFTRADRFDGKRIWRLRIGYLKLPFLQAVLLNYEGCRGLIHKTFPRVFIKGADGAARTSNVYDLEDLIDTVAGGAMGDALTTENVNVYRFMKYLTKQIESADKLKSNK